jgi:hypothetical protein
MRRPQMSRPPRRPTLLSLLAVRPVELWVHPRVFHPHSRRASSWGLRCMRGYHRCGAAISTAASKADDAPAQSPRTGVEPLQLVCQSASCLQLFSYLKLLWGRLSLRRRSVQRDKVRFADPEPMQQHRQFAGHRHNGSLLAVLASVLGEFQPESLQIAILPVAPQDVMGGLHQLSSDGKFYEVDDRLVLRLCRLTMGPGGPVSRGRGGERGRREAGGRP